MDAGTAERESKFFFVTIWKDGMIDIGGWEDGAFSQTKVRGKVGGAWIVEDDGMTNGVLSIFVDPRIQARIVIIVDFFVVDGLMVQSDGIGSPALERFTWFQGCLEVQVGDERSHFMIVLFNLGPLTLPYFDEPVPAGQ